MRLTPSYCLARISVEAFLDSRVNITINGMILRCLILRFNFLFSEAFNLLLAKGGDVGCQDHQQSTALHLAVQAGALKIVRRLLNPMLPNTLEIKDADQNTPVLIACMHNRLDILKLLLDKGADVSALNKDCMSCLDVAVESDSIQVARTLVKHDRFSLFNLLLI